VPAVVVLVAMATLGTGCGATKTDRLSVKDGTVNGKPGFDPAKLEAHKGRNVEITVANTGDKTHGFSIEGYDIARTVDQGKTLKVSFTAKQAGTFRVFCQLHPAHQPAQLVVS
jgi:nitrosocyanin